jgi:transcriptional regulator with XRE-family HTH domain
MNIGDVIRKSRIQRPGSSHGKMGLVELSERCGVSYGQIARIEKNQSQPRILTLVRIGDALGLTLEQIVHELELNHLIKKQWTSLRKYKIPLNLSRSSFLGLLRGENAKELAKTADLQKDSTFDLYRAKADDFPDEVTNLIAKEFASGSIITLEDLSCYLLSVRKKQNISQWELGKLVDIEYRAIQRLENAELQLIDWDLLLKIDQSLELNGALVGLAWAVAEFESGIFLQRILKEDIQNFWSDETKSRLTNLITLDRLHRLTPRGETKPQRQKAQTPKRTSEGIRAGN